MNNSVKDGYGKIIGFKCWTCGEVFDTMWGETCNKCRKQEDDNSKLRSEINRLTKAIENLTPHP